MIPQKAFSRREMLAGVTAVGSVGLFTGAATRAYLVDEERFHQSKLRSGKLNLELDWRTDTGAIKEGASDRAENSSAASNTDTRITVPTGDLDPGESGEASIRYRVCGTPANVWLRMEVTEGKARGALATTLKARLWHDDGCDTTTKSDETITKGVIAELVGGPLGSGLLLKQCILDCESRCVGMSWSLPSTPEPAIGGKTLSLEFEFVALQCANDATPENPWS